MVNDLVSCCCVGHNGRDAFGGDGLGTFCARAGLLGKRPRSYLEAEPGFG